MEQSTKEYRFAPNTFTTKKAQQTTIVVKHIHSHQFALQERTHTRENLLKQHGDQLEHCENSVENRHRMRRISTTSVVPLPKTGANTRARRTSTTTSPTIQHVSRIPATNKRIHHSHKPRSASTPTSSLLPYAHPFLPVSLQQLHKDNTNISAKLTVPVNGRFERPTAGKSPPPTNNINCCQ